MTSAKVYVGNLGTEVDKEAIEQEFSKFGLIKDVWIARNPPGFAFVIFNDPRDAEEAVRVMDNKRLCSSRIKVELSHTNEGRSRRNEQEIGRGRGQRSARNEMRTSMRDRSPPRFQFNRGPQYDELQSNRSSRMSPRGPPARGPPMRGPPPRATGQRRSEERFDRGISYDDRGRYQDPLPPRDRFAYERSSHLENEYDGFRNNGYRGEPQQPHNDRYNDRYPDRYDDRYGPPQPPERYRQSMPDRPPPRMDRGPDRFPERRPDRGMNSSSDRFVERFPRRSSPPPRGPPKINRMPPRSPPPRRSGRSPISRHWGRSRSPLR